MHAQWPLYPSLLLFSACGAGIAPGPKAGNAVAPTYPFYVVEFLPEGGAVAVLPTHVTVVFNKSELDHNTLQAITHYNLVCGSVTYAAQAVSSAAGSASVTVTLPAATGATTCTLYVSSSIEDEDGRPLDGPRSVTYQMP